MALQIRRGTDAERQGITPLAGELIYTTDTKKLYVGDGVTAGGNQVDTTLSAQYLAVPSNITPDASNSRDIGSTSAKWRTGYFQGLQVDEEITAVSINGNVVGNDSSVLVNVSNGRVTATSKGDLLASDDTTIVDHTAKTVTATTVGVHKGTVNADDNSLRIDGASDRITNSVLDFDGNVITLQSGNGIQIGTNSSAQGVGLEIYNTDHTARNALRIYSDDGNANTFNSIETYTSRGSIVTPTANAADDSLFGYINYGHDGSQYVQSSFIVAGVDSQASVGAGAVPGNIVMGTTPDNGVTNNFVVINKDGNLGVNILTPAEKLDVGGNIKTSGFVQFGSLTTAERNALTPANGMIIYNSTDNKFQGYENGGWANLI
jgi:hypothetical protein